MTSTAFAILLVWVFITMPVPPKHHLPSRIIFTLLGFIFVAWGALSGAPALLAGLFVIAFWNQPDPPGY